MKKYLHTLLFCFCLFGKAEAQINYGYSFKKVINMSNGSSINSTQELSDSSFVVAGSFTDTTGKIYVSKISKKGILIETHYYYHPSYNLSNPIIQVDNNDNIFMAFNKTI